MRLRRIFAASIGLALLPALTAASDDPVSSDVVTVLQSVTSAQEEDIPAAPETVDELLEAEGVEILDDPRGLLGTDSPSVQDSNEEAPPVLPAQEADDEQLREQVDAQNGIWYSDEAPVAQDDSVTTNALSEPEPVRPAIEDCQAIYNGGWGVPAEPPGYSDKSGYQMTRLDWCYIGQATYRTITCDSSGSCRVTRQATGTHTILGAGQHKEERGMRFHNRLDNWRNTIGDWQNIPVTLSMQCEPTVSTTSCEVSNSTVPRTIGQWIGNPDRTYYLLSRANEASGPGSGDGEDGLNSDGSVGQHRLSWYNIAFWVTDDGAAGARYRCDSHTTIPGSGCTFDHSPMPWPINTQGQTFGYQTADVGRHIVDTFLFAEDTVPRTNEAKRIPGVYMSNGPLQRLEGSQVDKNRAASVAACKAEWGAGYSEGGVYDCDEYPMASTYQGADTAPYPDENNFSVRRIVASENQSAGRYLGWFYRTYRVIDSDMYYVFPYGSS